MKAEKHGKTYSPYVNCIDSCRHLHRQLSSPVSAAVATCIGSCRHLYRQLSSPVSAAVHVSREEGKGAGRSTAIPVTVVINVLNHRHSQQRCGIGHSNPATQKKYNTVEDPVVVFKYIFVICVTLIMSYALCFIG